MIFSAFTYYLIIGGLIAVLVTSFITPDSLREDALKKNDAHRYMNADKLYLGAVFVIIFFWLPILIAILAIKTPKE